MTYADRIPAPRPVPTTRQRLTGARQSSLSLTQEIAHRLRTHQWYDNPKFPILHEPSAHGTHEGTGFTTDCAICTKKIDAIAEVAASVISERPDTARCGHTPDQHRHDDGQAADAASRDRAIRELTAERDRTRDERNERLTLAESSRLAKRYDQAAAERDEALAELGSAQELLAVVDDLAEQLDRARARYATRPEVTPVEPEERQLQHVSVLANCIACGARCPNGKCPNDTPVPPSSVPPRRAQEDAEPTRPGGCPETVWDGPYAMRCNMGGSVGVCATHGRFRPAERKG